MATIIRGPPPPGDVGALGWRYGKIFLLALSFNLAGDGLRDVLDPRDY